MAKLILPTRAFYPFEAYARTGHESVMRAVAKEMIRSHFAHKRGEADANAASIMQVSSTVWKRRCEAESPPSAAIRLARAGTLGDNISHICDGGDK